MAFEKKETYTEVQLRNLKSKKVDKVEGQGLSSNDFTDDYKEQLDNFTTPLITKEYVDSQAFISAIIFG